MATIWELAEDALDGLGCTVAANVLVLADGVERPDEYMTFFVFSATEAQSADDAETLRSWMVQVSYYNRAGLVGMPDIKSAMAAAGFRAGAWRELPYNQQTRHYGMALDFNYLA